MAARPPGPEDAPHPDLPSPVGRGAADAATSARNYFRTHPVLHTADFALPEARGDFGSGAVEGMQSSQAFVALIEYHPDSALTALFSSNAGMPRHVGTDDFSSQQLQRTIQGQGGTQVFFVEGGRAFCLYVVLGSLANRRRVVPRVNATLSSIEIESSVPKEWAEAL